MQLRVCIRNARHLPKMDLMGKCDPYILLSLGNQKQQSSIKYNTYDPDYDEEFNFAIADTTSSEPLTLDLMDWDRFTEHDYIGSLQIDINSILASLSDAGDSIERTFDVKNLRDSDMGAVTGHDGAHTQITVTFFSDDAVKSFSSHSASGHSSQSQEDKVIVDKVQTVQQPSESSSDSLTQQPPHFLCVVFLPLAFVSLNSCLLCGAGQEPGSDSDEASWELFGPAHALEGRPALGMDGRNETDESGWAVHSLSPKKRTATAPPGAAAPVNAADEEDNGGGSSRDLAETDVKVSR